MKRLFVLNLLALFIIGMSACNNQAEVKDTPPLTTTDQNTDVETTLGPTPALKKLETIEDFWAVFVEAVKAKDDEKIESLSFGELALGRQETTLYRELTYTRFIASTVDKLTSTTMEMPVEATDVYELHLNFAYDEDGNLLPEDHDGTATFLDSSEMFYFGKVDGEYRWILAMAAG